LQPVGEVFLVGGGPGDPGLLTVKGRRLLEQADVVVYDYLVDEGLLAYAPAGAELIPARDLHGNRAEQERINDLLIAQARQGKKVVRLKGGDPYLFGRGGEEAQALVAAGVPFQAVPGVTSALAVPAYAGIPVTHRDYASSVSILTGRVRPEKGQPVIDWQQVAGGRGTLVFLMAITNLDEVVQHLIEAGRSPETPAAAVRWGTRPDQRTVRASLRDLPQRVRDAGVKAPAVVVIGDVVRLADELNWFERLPLFGLGVLVTRAREQAGVFAERLRDAGAFVYQAPVIEIRPPDDWAPVDAAIERLRGGAGAAYGRQPASEEATDDVRHAGIAPAPDAAAMPRRDLLAEHGYDWVVFTSANGVRAFCERVWSSGGDARSFGGARLCAIGPETARALEAFGLKADLMPQKYVAEAVAGVLAPFQPRCVLIPRAKVARDVLPKALQAQGAEVDVVEVYETVVPDGAGDRIRELLASGKVDVVTFTSSSTARNFVQLAGPLPANVKVACIGPITAETAHALGLEVDIISDEYTTAGLQRELAGYLAASR
jgi:uroporphyrinogen III methyltransferase / synthase